MTTLPSNGGNKNDLKASQPAIGCNYDDEMMDTSSYAQRILRKRRFECAVTIYGIAFAPSSANGTDYLVACTSTGCLYVWRINNAKGGGDGDDLVSRSNDVEMKDKDDEGGDDDGDGDYNGKQNSTRTELAASDSSARPHPRKPVMQWKVTDGILYHVDFLHSKENATTRPLLVTAGQGGVFVYRWFLIQQQVENAHKPVSWEPCATLRPHVSLSLSPFSSSSSSSTLVPTMDIINGTSADATFVYGAGNQLYKWNVETSQCVAILSSSQSSTRRKHDDFLHTVKVVPTSSSSSSLVVTGGNDGKVGFWDGVQESLVEMLDCSQTLLDKKVLPTTLVGGDIQPLPSSLNEIWVSSLDASSTGNFLTLGGGWQGGRAASAPLTGGFVGQLHVSSRTMTSAYWTRECIQNVVVSSSALQENQHDFVTVGNECVVSYWERQGGRLLRSVGRSGAGGRAWITSPSAYALASFANPRTGASSLPSSSRRPSVSLVVAGRGPIVDCFANRGVKVCQLTVA